MYRLQRRVIQKADQGSLPLSKISYSFGNLTSSSIFKSVTDQFLYFFSLAVSFPESRATPASAIPHQTKATVFIPATLSQPQQIRPVAISTPSLAPSCSLDEKEAPDEQGPSLLL